MPLSFQVPPSVLATNLPLILEREAPQTFAVPVPVPVLDAGLSPSEVEAVTYALSREGQPENLLGFASTMEPAFPLAASLLRARAMEVAR